MGFRFRKSLRLGPVRVNLSKAGLSTTLRIGPWSWNSRTRRHSVDLPGPINWQSKGRRR